MTTQQQAAVTGPLDEQELALIDGYWRAANYLSVGQIYLLDNPLLREPLRLEHVKPRLLGHWGTTPGLNLIYVHLNRVIRAHDRQVLYVTGPGHGGPGLVARRETTVGGAAHPSHQLVERGRSGEQGRTWIGHRPRSSASRGRPPGSSRAGAACDDHYRVRVPEPAPTVCTRGTC